MAYNRTGHREPRQRREDHLQQDRCRHRRRAAEHHARAFPRRRRARSSRASEPGGAAVELAEEGRTNKKGMPKPLDFAVFTKEFRNEVVGAFPPVWVQRATLAPLVAIAERRGHSERYQPLRPAVA